MAMLLPMGILENTREIYAEVALYDTVPPENIWQYWKAYTTINRRLVDPTAYRLENFWWHVLGSDRRNLKGPALAKLFEHFTTGSTFVPLKGPSNRFDGPLRSRVVRPDLNSLNSGGSEQKGLGNEQDGSLQGKLKSPTPSSSRPPPPHPILKKSRGPSTTGPRPTARFVSPPPSDGEDDKDGCESSGSTAVASSDFAPSDMPSALLPPTQPQEAAAPAMAPAATTTTTTMMGGSGGEIRPPPTPSPAKGRKGSTPTFKKIVASTAVSKRRPVLPRRQGSQSSAGSDISLRDAAPVVLTRFSGNQQLSGPGPTEKERRGSQEGSMPSPSHSNQAVALSAKASGKQPASTPSKSATPRISPAQTDGHHDRPVVDWVAPERRSSAASLEAPQGRRGSRRPAAGLLMGQAPGIMVPRMERSRSDMESPRHSGKIGLGRPLIATSVVGTSDATAQGLIGSDNATYNTIDSETRDLPDRIRLASQPSSQVLLDMPFKPTPRNPAPPVPFGRSKSELTLLLERGKTHNDG
ncbi:hypothetical protein B0T26DRAFT_504029 [Lasiosphaeria miniovina]|uniref:Nitrogen regulatory protein areA GATA-like domain-containing protein n=1 Tax=Lasiosphaeria miniovina TaxID=1954250 RepID=A0AA39ZTY8_9PEZI|nr:uncharacterized protein B0T26DRAFT_504029 [Lasiosphaeria miniovina]KAK0703541.1 hypothetical protein B0T26DRAFT_504029 [Lasiosphaeria miniovina]